MADYFFPIYFDAKPLFYLNRYLTTSFYTFIVCGKLEKHFCLYLLPISQPQTSKLALYCACISWIFNASEDIGHQLLSFKTKMLNKQSPFTKIV